MSKEANKPHSPSKPGSTRPYSQIKPITNRLAKISGHVDSIKHMVEDGRDCRDILIQLSAVDSAIKSVGKVILKDHMEQCIIEALRENDIKAVDEFKKSLDTFIK